VFAQPRQEKAFVAGPNSGLPIPSRKS